MRIRGCKAHNACRGNGGGKGLGAERAVTPITPVGTMGDVRDKGITD